MTKKDFGLRKAQIITVGPKYQSWVDLYPEFFASQACQVDMTGNSGNTICCTSSPAEF